MNIFYRNVDFKVFFTYWYNPILMIALVLLIALEFACALLLIVRSVKGILEKKRNKVFLKGKIYEYQKAWQLIVGRTLVTIIVVIVIVNVFVAVFVTRTLLVGVSCIVKNKTQRVSTGKFDALKRFCDL